jgi:SAM-dependent methyltransferase
VPYFTHRYHYTWLNERAVEIALAQRVLADHPGARVLEIGNVLGHYQQVSHTVVDKYEQAPGVHNVDVADLDLGAEFDLVIAISTLEHVGLDEDVANPEKPARAVARLREHLAPGGLLWVTHPVGYNPALDEQIRTGAIRFTELRALRRDGRRNRWSEVPVDQVWSAAYDRLLYTAHGIVVAELRIVETPADVQVPRT